MIAVNRSSHSFYDQLLNVSGDILDRRGTVSVLPEGEGHGKEVAFCPLVAMWRYSTLDQDPNDNDDDSEGERGQLIPRSGSIAAALGQQELHRHRFASSGHLNGCDYHAGFASVHRMDRKK
mmetsp:Transcript_6000/g.13051  ORF Transcript_6000/g.13051 Transcript_6000/m.13051 type:complete len:121 (+) Transcript_6000:296-658(+)